MLVQLQKKPGFTRKNVQPKSIKSTSYKLRSALSFNGCNTVKKATRGHKLYKRFLCIKSCSYNSRNLSGSSIIPDGLSFISFSNWSEEKACVGLCGLKISRTLESVLSRLLYTYFLRPQERYSFLPQVTHRECGFCERRDHGDIHYVGVAGMCVFFYRVICPREAVARMIYSHTACMLPFV